ncbi:hypothetical protein O6H91_01G001000 [Diphasiastrum complanatum]|uniref:Uncharacterized protein n=1 Tax=Diphasiastrum complanatum TaxID=34168 RepID=A0ACC2EMB7_DIPCM|nr:hypothetical protein O6H91_01G001000 [Diphasiastrum complanatum]
MTDERLVEVNVMAAEDLKDVKPIGRMSPYVVAWIDISWKCSTRICRNGGKHSYWNEILLLPIKEESLQRGSGSLKFEIYSKGPISPTAVGFVQIPVAQISFLARPDRTRDVELFTKEVHRPSGKVQGALYIAIRLGEVGDQPRMINAPPQRDRGNPIDEGISVQPQSQPRPINASPPRAQLVNWIDAARRMNSDPVMGYPAAAVHGIPYSEQPQRRCSASYAQLSSHNAAAAQGLPYLPAYRYPANIFKPGWAFYSSPSPAVRGPEQAPVYRRSRSRGDLNRFGDGRSLGGVAAATRPGGTEIAH